MYNMSTRKHAALIGDEVVAILDVSQEQYPEVIKGYTLLLDVEDLLIKPEVGWKLVNNILQPPAGQSISMEAIIRAKIQSYQEQAPALLRDLYTQNTLLGITTQQSDQMFQDYQDVLIRIREGAWPTALYRLSQKSPSGFVTQPMIDAWYNLILSKLA
jgi:hypothetical protein